MRHASDYPEATVQTRKPITGWLDHLRVLLPPRHVLLVGAGGGTSPWVQWLRDADVPATLVEADEAQAARLQQTTEGHTGWQVRTALVGAEADTATFHVASMASESGLVEPETLRTVWPNLRTRHKQARMTVALAELLMDESHPANWLLLDCLPPVALLQSARSALSGVDLLLVRSLLRAEVADEAHADEEALQALLGAEGFRRVAVEPGRHPALGHLLWVRDPAAALRIKPEQLAALQEQADQLTRALDASATRESAWVVERQALLARAAEAAEAKSVAGQLTAERQRNATQIQELQRAVAAADAKAADAEHKAQAVQKALADARMQLEQLSAERQRNAAQIKLLQEAATQSDQTLRAMNDTLRQKQEAATTAQVEKLQGELTDTRATIEQLTAERQRNAVQIQQLQRAVTAAEAKTADLAREAEASQRALADAHASLEQQAAERQRNASQIKLLQEAAMQAEAKASALQAEVTQLAQAAGTQTKLAQLNAQLAQAKEAAEQRGKAHSQELRDLLTRLTALQEHSGKTDQALLALNDSLRAQQASVSKLGADLPAQWNALEQTTLAPIAQSLKALGTETAKQSSEAEARLRNDLKKGLANAVKQMESFIGIQNYLATGDLIAEFHGWPISPDVGLFLLEKVRQKNYDLIIEFGSGTSTVLFARALQLASARQPDTDAPQRRRIISFEHDVRYFERTASMLAAARVGDMVDLVHAPLVTWTDGGQPQLFYDCASTLDGIAQSLEGRTASILVLVDGPPGATGPNARYPSAPVVFEKLGRHQIDLALDDADRPDEKAVLGLWKEFWKVRGYQVTLENHSAEKGLAFATSLAAGMK